MPSPYEELKNQLDELQRAHSELLSVVAGRNSWQRIKELEDQVVLLKGTLDTLTRSMIWRESDASR